MIKDLLNKLKDSNSSSELVKRAQGKYKLPLNYKEFKNYIKTNI